MNAIEFRDGEALVRRYAEGDAPAGWRRISPWMTSYHLAPRRWAWFQAP